jgi:translation initiation factor 2B subunit (eIF-2B alpha/beta/delta family)
MANMDFAPLVDYLRDGSLIAFLGAGVSRSYKEATSGRSYSGLATAGDLVSLLAQRRKYVTNDMTFGQACFLFKKKEGRGELEKFLAENLDKPAIAPLPAHVILANQGYAAFLTSNFDKLLERALQESRRMPHVIVTDEDVSRLRPAHVPIIKVHGCISQPSTVIAADDECLPLGERYPLVEALIKSQLANKALLFLGFSLADLDFNLVFEETRRILRDRMPRGFAVMHRPRPYLVEYWKDRGVTVFDSDLTDFLRGLLRASVDAAPPPVYLPAEDWINNAFFESLHKIRTLPSETQVIDAFLGHLLQEVRSSNFELQDVLDRAGKAAQSVLARRPNFEAMRNVAAALIANIRKSCSSKDQAELEIQRVLDERLAFGRGIARKGASAVEKSDNLLVFSQSVRVIEFLKGVPRGVQDTCKVFVAECRPKSPVPFQDALAVCEQLVGTGYEVEIVPDASAGSLIYRDQITKVLMGAHAVYMRNGKPTHFVNTGGSHLILAAACERNLPIYVVAESAKLRHLNDIEDLPQTDFHEEEDLFGELTPAISDLKAAGLRIGALNVGYDRCEFADNVVLVTES